MKIPEARELTFPTLEALAALGGSGTLHEINALVIDSVGFSPEQLAVKKAGTNQTVVEARLGWARTSLKRTGEIYNPRRGLWALEGVEVSDWEAKNIWYGTCIGCGMVIEKKTAGWYNGVERIVRCTTCGKPSEVAESPVVEDLTPERSPVSNLREDPVSGSSMLREAQSRNDQNYLKGATGEYLTGVKFKADLHDGIVVLSDRFVPGSLSNVDHIVVAPSGVWVVETKNWHGKIRYKESVFKGTKRLMVGEYDRTTKIDAMFGLVIPVAQVVNDKSVDVRPAMVLLDGNWAFGSMFRRLVHKTVLITGLDHLVKEINAPGRLDVEQINEIAARLDDAFVPR